MASSHIATVSTYVKPDVWKLTWNVEDPTSINNELSKNMKHQSISLDNLGCLSGELQKIITEDSDNNETRQFPLNKKKTNYYYIANINFWGNLITKLHKVTVDVDIEGYPRRSGSTDWVKSNNEICIKSLFEQINNDGKNEPMCTSFKKITMNIIVTIFKSEQFQIPFKKELVPSLKPTDTTSLLYTSKKYADLTIKVKESIFQAHKLILSAASEVFARMLESDFAEQKSGQVLIEDMEPEDFEELLTYIYTGKITNNEKATVGLCLASEKYNLPELKNFCIAQLALRIDCKNAFTICDLASLLNEKDLKEKAVIFIVHNKAIFSAPELEKLYGDHDATKILIRESKL